MILSFKKFAYKEPKSAPPRLSEEVRSLKARFEQFSKKQEPHENFLVQAVSKQDEIFAKLNQVLDTTSEKKLINGFTKVKFYFS